MYLSLFRLLCAFLFLVSLDTTGAIRQTKGDFEDKFRQLDEVLPTANIYRNAGGEPGHHYWQQNVDYQISVTLDEDKRRLEGSERVNYTNNSPDTLRFLWLQLDQNRFRTDSMAELTRAFADKSIRGSKTEDANGEQAHRISIDELRRQQFMADHSLGYEISNVKDDQGRELPIPSLAA